MHRYFPRKKGINISKLKITDEGKYSVSKPEDAKITNKVIYNYFKTKNITITDATANNGGNTINFALDFSHINAVEISKKQFDVLQHNIDVYGLKNVTMYQEDYLKVMLRLQQDVIFIDAPWGGRGYRESAMLDLFLGNVNLVDVVKTLHESNVFKLCILKVPHNYNYAKLFSNINIRFDVYSLKSYAIICIYR